MYVSVWQCACQCVSVCQCVCVCQSVCVSQCVYQMARQATGGIRTAIQRAMMFGDVVYVADCESVSE